MRYHLTIVRMAKINETKQNSLDSPYSVKDILGHLNYMTNLNHRYFHTYFAIKEMEIQRG